MAYVKKEQKRKVLAWMTIGVLASDVATEAIRAAVCNGEKGEAAVQLCEDRPPNLRVIAQKVKALYAVWAEMQEDAPDPANPQSQTETQGDELREALGE